MVKCIRQDNMLLVFILVSVFTVFDVSEGQGTVTVPWYENLPAVAMDYKAVSYTHLDVYKRQT